MFAGKPIIGVAGGIGSGKSFVAKLFGELGCLVINSDDLAKQAYRDFSVKQALRHWWGSLVFDPNGEIDRGAVARKIFTLPTERKRLEQLLHPLVNAAREKAMKAAAGDAQVIAYVWDTPLLFETGLYTQCDAVVFVEASEQQRLARTQAARGWDASELASRENLQMPLDNKREISEYVISNDAAGTDQVRAQVREVLSRILAGLTPTARPH